MANVGMSILFLAEKKQRQLDEDEIPLTFQSLNVRYENQVKWKNRSK
jgi:hypothetical protein